MQGAFISEEEVEAVVEHVKTLGQPDYIDDEIVYDEDEDEASPSLFSDGEDPLYDKALEIVLQQGKASASYIQRRLKIGYNRAARLVEEMDHHGVVGPAQGSKPRDLLRAYSS
jgi:S-DNA-T family DNA segregation ATPase FtsK/SpoIIIE